MRLIFLTTVALSGLNASLVFWDAFRSSAPGITVAVGTIFLAIGLLFALIQHYLSESLAMARDLKVAKPLMRLQRSIAVLAAGAGLFMLGCLAGIISRFQEGYALFG